MELNGPYGLPSDRGSKATDNGVIFHYLENIVSRVQALSN